MNRRIQLLSRMAAILMIAVLCFYNLSSIAEASGGEEYITIRVQASDENEGLKYAIDSDDDAAFSEQNEFTIPAGTSHTIYVKDAAGNITSQTYNPSTGSNNVTTGTMAGEEDTQQINIDLELGNGKNEDYSNYEYLTDDPVGTGTGTVTSKIKTDGSDSAEKVFYTVTADSGEVFYMVIDQSQSTDNVYLLNAVTLNDLKSLAEDNNSSGTNAGKENTEEDNLLDALRKSNSNDGDSGSEASEKGKNPNSVIGNNIIFLLILVIGGGVYYYLKVYKNKKDEMMDTMDAMDIDEFEAEAEEDDGEEVEFDIDEEEKERILNRLVEEDDEEEEEEFYNMDPDTYAGSKGYDGSENEKETESEIGDDEEEKFQFADESEEDEEEEEE